MLDVRVSPIAQPTLAALVDGDYSQPKFGIGQQSIGMFKCIRTRAYSSAVRAGDS